MTQIDYFFSPISPFTYLAGMELEKIAARHGASIAYKPMNVVEIFGRTGGTAPKDRHPNRQAYRLQDLSRISKLSGMALNLQPAHWPTNPAPASYTIIAAQSAGGGDIGGLAHALCRACWAEEKDIAQDDVIREALVGNGFDAGLADSGMLQGAETFAANNEEAVNRGVFGAPSYLVDDQVFWGQDRLSHLDAYLAGDL